MTGATAFPKAAVSGEINHFSRQEFLSLYPNRHQSILKPRGCETWVTMSRHAALSDDTIWSAVSATEDTYWGCRWSDRSRFTVLDVDAAGQYHNELGLARLKHALASVGINSPLLYRSSLSGGWHIYISWDDWIESGQLSTTFKQWLQKESFEVRNGQLEIFPSNNGLRLPMQRGFAWLDEHGTIVACREDLSQDEAVAKFLKDLDAHSNSWQIVKQLIETRIKVLGLAAASPPPFFEQEPEEGFSAFFTMAGLIPEVFEHGRRYLAQGLTGPNQRHHAILCIGHYLWYGDELAGVTALPGIRNAGRRAEAIEQWLRANHNGYSQSVLRGDWNEVAADIKRACNWAPSEGTERSYERYALTDRCIDRLTDLTKQTGRVWTPTYLEKGNINREEAARQKIRAALTQLVDSGRRVTVRGLQRLCGCKRETIRRHIDMWGALRLSNGPGDLSLLLPIDPPSSEAALPVVELIDFDPSGWGSNTEPVADPAIGPVDEEVPGAPGRGQEAQSVGHRLVRSGPLYPALLRAGSSESCLCYSVRGSGSLLLSSSIFVRGP